MSCANKIIFTRLTQNGTIFYYINAEHKSYNISATHKSYYDINATDNFYYTVNMGDLFHFLTHTCLNMSKTISHRM